MSSKNKKSELLTKIKQLFNSMPTTAPAPVPVAAAPAPVPTPAPAPVPAAPMVMKTVDGIDVSMDKMEVGGKCMINGVAAPANTYVFEDGSSVTTDTEGVITMVTPKAVTAPAPAPAAQAPAPAPQTMAKLIFTDENKTPEGINKLFASFATGTTEERISNLELVAKALMEYSFGWEIRRAKEEKDKADAIAIFTNTLAGAEMQLASQKELISTMIEFVEEFATTPAAEPPVTEKRKFTFGKNDAKGKGLSKFQAAAAAIAKEKEEAATAK